MELLFIILLMLKLHRQQFLKMAQMFYYFIDDYLKVYKFANN